MLQYIFRRIFYAIPILIGVNILTFALFFIVNTPDNMARMQLGDKHVTKEAIEQWKINHGYNKALFFNEKENNISGKITNTIFFDKSIKMFVGDLGFSDDGRNIKREIQQRMLPSLAIALPTFILGILAAVSTALILSFFYKNGFYKLDFFGVIICILMMSISGLFYIIGGQFLFAIMLKLVPISGFGDGFFDNIRFVILPVLIGVIAGLGGSVRWYRALFLEEINKDYVKTAIAKGLNQKTIYFKHILQNALIPILTGVVVVIPSLFMGSLLMESFFGIPGLGSFTIEAIQSQDFSIVRAMVFVGSVLYIIGLILTDISYTLVDPRIKLN